jgi:predicted CXXCH cytochrome family protein
MRSVWGVVMVAVASLAAVVSIGLTRGEQGAVIGGPHDLGAVSGNTGVSACEMCHLPSDAGSLAVWSKDPHAGDKQLAGISASCYSCHDGTVASSGLHVFDSALSQHVVQPGVPGKDCTMCHDPHVSEYGNFLRFPSGANLCRTCHTMTGHPVNVDAARQGNLPGDHTFDPATGDFSGSRLWSADGASAGSTVKCLSCHAAHGAADSNLVSVAPGDLGSSALCMSCHQREGNAR